MAPYICTACGGPKCMYCGHNWRKWWTRGGSRYRGHETDVEGLYGTWVTDTLLLMSRPSTRINREYSLPTRLHSSGIRAIVCLQEVGEHPFCGDNLQESGLSYMPDEFEREGIKFINPSWEDLNVPTVEHMLNVVKFMYGIISAGGKVAVHCHAGLGRAGLTGCCYLLYSDSTQTSESVLDLVRRKRSSGTVQNDKQEQFLRDFEAFARAGKPRL
ncbi:phosphatases II [Gonapodya prolifera JEL478]|uniref:Phosphatases II n=1 Tax=Gonapodya prolifera (strain JEL478) TaxID=1344416 RepID=A0A138ZYR6_GONPJ|nr:phosphatases II [Gonapodya prolifera JEL478]|eukprot:KXS09621.1 phosphatases II [Gonapodya prolifera JEL478]